MTDLTAGAIAGREHVLVLNTGTHASPTLTEMPQARNFTWNKKRDSSAVEMHGNIENDHTTGNLTKDGSFEYVKKRGTDTTFDALNDAIDDGTIEEIGMLDGPANLDASAGVMYPLKLTELNEVANGNSETVYSISFVRVHAYASGTYVGDIAITGTTPTP
jgi:hypothetical protein